MVQEVVMDDDMGMEEIVLEMIMEDRVIKWAAWLLMVESRNLISVQPVYRY